MKLGFLSWDENGLNEKPKDQDQVEQGNQFRGRVYEDTANSHVRTLCEV